MISSTSSPPTTSRPGGGASATHRLGLGGDLLAARRSGADLQVRAVADFGFQTWRPTLYAYILWAVCLCWSQVLIRGEHGKRTLFVLPAALFVISLTVFPLLFGLLIAFSDWNLSSPLGRQVQRPRQYPADVERSVLLERACATWSGTAWRSLSNTPSPSAWRCCSTPKSGRASSSAWHSCCR